MKIEQVNESNKGYFKAIDTNTKAGLMTYSWAGTDKIIIDHTEVNPDFKGQNVGKNMVLEAVAFARKSNIKILPLCPFAKSVFDKNPDLHDVLF
ncbi:GNAT family N-acetyltransferase [Flavobacterium sp. UBA4197]|uniref:GNAT family N-acetyltransferase n=1 Tax=Flavobacterium sp. UBA4197 TaxID=1946546 RepID=UPI00257E4445|nr:GNAT family N-acetyltransferase [Flavobacterium sp. UBA4197]